MNMLFVKKIEKIDRYLFFNYISFENLDMEKKCLYINIK